MTYQYYRDSLLELLYQLAYDDNYRTYDYEILNRNSQRFTLPNGMRITF